MPDGGNTMKDETNAVARLVAASLGLLVLVVGGGMAGCPTYNIYKERLSGEAELAKAEYSKKVAVQEALAKQESAKALAEAEIIRARGVAEANRIIGESLTGNEAYLRYLWIQTLENGKNDVIYVPTEANLPVLEAGRHAVRAAPTVKP
jgi:predicted aminopeptidase